LFYDDYTLYLTTYRVTMSVSWAPGLCRNNLPYETFYADGQRLLLGIHYKTRLCFICQNGISHDLYPRCLDH